MNLIQVLKRPLSALVALCFALAGPLFGQGITTSGISGFVTDSQGRGVPGATVTVVHEPSSTRGGTTSRANGQYNISGLRTGGPYTVTVSAPALQTETRSDVFLDLGDAAVLNVALKPDVVVMAQFTVTGDRDLTFGAGRIGPSTLLTEQEIAQVPTVRRDVQDIASLDSRLFLGQLEVGGQLSAQGQNFRFNSFLIDGVQSQDTFGLQSNGFPSLKGPIPLEAIESLSVELAPYDVRRGGFTGALLNAVTKSGTNRYRGSVYYEYTDKELRAKNPVSGRKEAFDERTYGVTFSGPILRDRLFFFFNYDDFKRNAAPPQANFIPDPVQLEAIIARAKALGYDPGNLQADNRSFQETIIGKLDWNIAAGHRASFTYRRNEGLTTTFPNYTFTSDTSLSNYWYDSPRKTESYNAQLNSQWTADLRTELTVSTTDWDGSPRNKGTPFPMVRVQGVTGTRLDTGATITNGSVYLGVDSARQMNEISTTEKQAKFVAEYSWGDHTFTAGVEQIQTKYNNSFVQFTNGSYQFSNLAAWQAGTPVSQFILARPFPGSTIEDAIARWRYEANAVYLQDTWKPNQRWTVLGGLRLDYPYIPEKPPVAAGFTNAGFSRDNGRPVTRNDTTNSGNWTLAPRVGFTYNVPVERKTQVRGGVGLFQGKSPAVWISNAYSNAGSVGSVSVTNPAGVTFNPNPATQTPPAGNPPAPAINITDPDLVQPSVWKSNLALDHQLPFGNITFSAEVYYNKTHKGLNVEFLNYVVPTSGPATMPDGRPRFAGTVSPGGTLPIPGVTSAAQFPGATSVGAAGVVFPTPPVTGRRRVNTGGPTGTGFADVFYLTNTNKGEGKGLTLSLRRPLTARSSWGWSASWTRAEATEVGSFTSSVAASNYSLRAAWAPNEDVASIANTNIRDRIVATYTKRLELIKRAPTTVSLVYQGRSGRPYSWVFRGDANGDGYSSNDLFYVPSGPTDPRVRWISTAERDDFFAFVSESTLQKYRGRYTPRNSERAPWVNTLDLKISQELPIWDRVKADVYLNVLNIGNLLNDEWGRLVEVGFPFRRAVAGATFDPAGNGGQGQWLYTFNRNNTLEGTPTVANDTPVSRWQAQVGMRIRF
jgi:outer membrane receptor for ferrienterochelin and colicin